MKSRIPMKIRVLAMLPYIEVLSFNKNGFAVRVRPVKKYQWYLLDYTHFHKSRYITLLNKRIYSGITKP